MLWVIHFFRNRAGLSSAISDLALKSAGLGQSNRNAGRDAFSQLSSAFATAPFTRSASDNSTSTTKGRTLSGILNQQSVREKGQRLTDQTGTQTVQGPSKFERGLGLLGVGKSLFGGLF